MDQGRYDQAPPSPAAPVAPVATSPNAGVAPQIYVPQAPVLPVAGAVFGVPLDRLRDSGLQRNVLLVAGIALLASVIIPYAIHPTIFAWDLGDTFGRVVWPVLAGGAYLFVTRAPANLRANVPPAVLHWAPFAVAVIGLVVGKTFGGLYTLGYATLVVGLLVLLARPHDRVVRIVIAVGAAMLVPDYFDALKFVFHFQGVGALGVIHNLLWFAVWTMAILCVLFAVPPQKLPPALHSLDAFAPMICAALIAWPPTQILLMTLGLAGVSGTAILALAHGLVPVFAYFAVLIVTAPAAYDEFASIVARQKAGMGTPAP